MGQYHILANFTKKEFVHPHRLGNGAKLWENIGFNRSMSTALFMLMAVSNNRGGGDFHGEDNHSNAKKKKIIGRWGGDYVAVIGDYYEPTDLKNLPADIPTTFSEAEPNYDLYDYVRDNFTDISKDIVRVFDYEFKNEEDEGRKTLRPNMVINLRAPSEGDNSNV